MNENVIVSSDFKKSRSRLYDQRVRKAVEEAIYNMKNNTLEGDHIQKNLFPREYKKYRLNNLWRFELPKGYRLLYTRISEDGGPKKYAILDVLPHHEYERLFGY